MLPRTLEPEVMDEESEVQAYDEMDHDEVNRLFVEDFLREFSPDRESRILDIGTGTGLIPIEFTRQSARGCITGVDLSERMIEQARKHVARLGLEERLDFIVADASRLPMEDGRIEAIMSNSIVHHLPDPLPFFRECSRLLKPGGFLFVRDLHRPETSDQVESLVATHAGREGERQQQLLRQSFHAALTVDEVASMLSSIPELPARIEKTSDRHWTLISRKQ